MHKFNLYDEHRQYFSPKIIAMVTKLYQYKGRLEVFTETMEKDLSLFIPVAKRHSAIASNKISGITAPDSRLDKLFAPNAEPKRGNEEEIAGYFRVLDSILGNYDYIPCKPYYILQLHRDLYSFSRTKIGGQYKNMDRRNEGTFLKGTDPFHQPFRPVRAIATERAMDDLYDSFNSALETEGTDPLILIPIMLLDFLCIHPFKEGTDRMFRLLAILNCCKHGFILAKYISLEQIMEERWQEFHEAFLDSSDGWHENTANYEPFICWFLSILMQGYAELENRIGNLKSAGKTKSQLIEKFIDEKNGKFNKKELLEYFPGISEITIERTLSSLCRKKKIAKTGASRATFYVRN